jgi:predicted RNA binding protein YcfA (HicA-like mRNA interferase family)
LTLRKIKRILLNAINKGGVNVRPSEFIRSISKLGFKRIPHKGTNHDYYTNGERFVMVERHNKEIKAKTLAKMKKDAGLK